MDLRLMNELALITSSTKGTGKTVTIEAAREETDVIINGRNETEVTKVVKETQTVFPDTYPQAGTADISVESQRVTLLEKFPRVNILMNNVGIFELMGYWDIDDAAWEKFFTVGVLSNNALTKTYLPRMFARDFSCVIFITNEETVIPSNRIPQCSMTKTVDLSLAKSLPDLTVGTYITASTIMSSPTLTEGVEKMLKDIYVDSDTPKKDWKKDFMRSHRSHLQIQRLIRPEEISCFVTFVASPDPSSFSGGTLRINGGLVPAIF